MKVFVYGTLKKGYHNSYLLKSAKFIGQDIIKGFDLYNTPFGYPFIIKGAGIVEGEVYEIDEATLKSLDWLEGYNEHDIARSLYRREEVKTGAGHIAYVYTWMRGKTNGELINGRSWEGVKKY